ncbi:MAG: universal stress protein [Candidatus Microthrix sp.]|nr:universal stress protein [Candidatus Microthrix sp.]
MCLEIHVHPCRPWPEPTEYLPVPGTGYLTSPVQTYDPRVMDRTARIIVGVDHSQESLNALEFAVEEAALRRVQLEVIWAWSDHTPRSDAFGGAGDGVDVQLSAQRQLEGLVESWISDDLDVTIRQSSTNPTLRWSIQPNGPSFSSSVRGAGAVFLACGLVRSA